MQAPTFLLRGLSRGSFLTTLGGPFCGPFYFLQVKICVTCTIERKVCLLG